MSCCQTNFRIKLTLYCQFFWDTVYNLSTCAFVFLDTKSHNILKMRTDFDAIWHSWSSGQRHETANFGGHEVKDQGHTAPNRSQKSPFVGGISRISYVLDFEGPGLLGLGCGLDSCTEFFWKDNKLIIDVLRI